MIVRREWDGSHWVQVDAAPPRLLLWAAAQDGPPWYRLQSGHPIVFPYPFFYGPAPADLPVVRPATEAEVRAWRRGLPAKAGEP